MNQSNRYFRYFTYIQPVLKIPIIKTYGYPIMTIAALIIFIIFAIKPTIETILALQQDLTNQQEVLKKLNQKMDDLSQGKQNYQNIDPALRSKIQTLVPGNVNLASLINSLEQTASSSAASISALQFQPVTIEPSQPSITSHLEEISFTYNIEGGFDTLKLALQNLKNSSRLMAVTNLIISKVADANLLMSISGKAFYLK